MAILLWVMLFQSAAKLNSAQTVEGYALRGNSAVAAACCSHG